MTGPEHYREAERLLQKADEEAYEVRVEQQHSWLLAALVNATLAQTAATVEAIASRGPGDITCEWNDIIWPNSEAAS